MLVYKLTERAWNRRRAVHAAWGFTALAVPTHEWMRSFDSFGIFFLLLAVWLVVVRQRAAAVLAVTAGMLVKVLPAVGTVLVVRSTQPGAVAWPGGLESPTYRGANAFWIAVAHWVEASISTMLHRPPWGRLGALRVRPRLGGNPQPLDPATATAYDFVGRMPT